MGGRAEWVLRGVQRPAVGGGLRGAVPSMTAVPFGGDGSMISAAPTMLRLTIRRARKLAEAPDGGGSRGAVPSMTALLSGGEGSVFRAASAMLRVAVSRARRLAEAPDGGVLRDAVPSMSLRFGGGAANGAAPTTSGRLSVERMRWRHRASPGVARGRGSSELLPVPARCQFSPRGDRMRFRSDGEMRSATRRDRCRRTE
jgi:hypothetical protein